MTRARPGRVARWGEAVHEVKDVARAGVAGRRRSPPGRPGPQATRGCVRAVVGVWRPAPRVDDLIWPVYGRGCDVVCGGGIWRTRVGGVARRRTLFGDTAEDVVVSTRTQSDASTKPKRPERGRASGNVQSGTGSGVLGKLVRRSGRVESTARREISGQIRVEFGRRSFVRPTLDQPAAPRSSRPPTRHALTVWGVREEHNMQLAGDRRDVGIRGESRIKWRRIAN